MQSIIIKSTNRTPIQSSNSHRIKMNSQKIQQYTNGQLLNEFNTLKEAAKNLKLSEWAIRQALKKQEQTPQGWEFKRGGEKQSRSFSLYETIDKIDPEAQYRYDKFIMNFF